MSTFKINLPKVGLTAKIGLTAETKLSFYSVESTLGCHQVYYWNLSDLARRNFAHLL